MTKTRVPDFAERLVRWQRQHGRHDLPWQNTRDPYRVWLSEIMLQQTQVSTVLPYFSRFLSRFPDVQALAAAGQDEVMGLWSGLGYYSRARNLHRCAQQVCQTHGGVFPATAAELQMLAGIGPSTAAAIASLCFDERVTILDGNVRRVVCRVLGYDKDLSVSAHERRLWSLAAELLPQAARSGDMPAYTQGLMDLGATLCTRSRPQCGLCPFTEDCQANAKGMSATLPLKSRKLKRSAESHWLLIARNALGQVQLVKRPANGIWASLFALPMHLSREALAQSVPTYLQAGLQDQAPFVHVLTHKDLHLHPVLLQTTSEDTWGDASLWHGPAQWPALGLPAPVRQLLQACA